MVGLVGVAEGDPEGGQAEHAGEHVQGEAAPEHRHEQRVGPLGGGHAGPDGGGEGRAHRGPRRLHRALADQLDPGGVPPDVGLQLVVDVGRPLGVDQAHVALGHGFGGQDGLGALAAVAAVEAVDGQGRPGGQPLGEAPPGRRVQLLQPQVGLDRVQVDRQQGQGIPLGRPQRLDLVGEPLDRDPAVAVPHGGQQVDQRPQRVGDDAAPVARVQRPVGPPGPQLEAGDPPDPEHQPPAAGRVDRPVAPDDQVGGEPLALAPGEAGQVGRADLLLAVQQHLDRAGELAPGGQQALDGQELGQVLALVVGAAAAVQAAVADLGLERRAGPGVQRVGRLHVVVAVDEHGGGPGRPGPVAEDQRPAGRLLDGRLQPGRGHQVAGVAGGPGHALAGGAHARDPDPAGQALHERRPVGVDVGEHVVQPGPGRPAHGVLGSSHRLVMSGLLSQGEKVQFRTREDQKNISRS